MFKQFTNCDLAMIAIDLEEEEQKNIRRRTWVHEILLKRHIEGEFVTLYKQLTDHEENPARFFIHMHISFTSTMKPEKLQPRVIERLKKQFNKKYIKNSGFLRSLNVMNGSENLTSIYDITVTDLYGKDVHLSKYKGKALLIVNYGETTYLAKDNVKNLTRLTFKYGHLGFRVLMFPCNNFYENFGGNNAGMRLKKNHPEFDVFAQVNVNGHHTHLLYNYLKSRLPGRTWLSTALTSGFYKFLIDRNGKPYQRFNSLQLFESIEEALKEVLIKDYI